MKIERTRESKKCSCGDEAVVCFTTDDDLKIHMCQKCFVELSDIVFEELQKMYFETLKLVGN